MAYCCVRFFVCSLPVIVQADTKSVESQKSFSQGVKENPMMGFITSKHGELWMQEVHSQPEDGSLSISYNNDQQTHTTSVSAKKIPTGMEPALARTELTKAIAVALDNGNEEPVQERRFTTDAGHEVNCAGVIREDKRASSELCMVVFENYYIQANMVWPLGDDVAEDKAFSRSDEFVGVVMDRFGEYPEI